MLLTSKTQRQELEEVNLTAELNMCLSGVLMGRSVNCKVKYGAV